MRFFLNLFEDEALENPNTRRHSLPTLLELKVVVAMMLFDLKKPKCILFPH